MKMRRLFAAFAAGFFLFAGCSGTAQKEAKERQGGEAVATIGNVVLTVEELNAMIESLPAHARPQLATDEDKRKFVEQFYETIAVAEVAREAGGAESVGFRTRMKLAENQLLAQTFMQEKLKGLEVSDEDARKYYEENAAEFSGGQVKASHILVETLEEAVEIRRELAKDPGRFEKLARERSTCTSKERGGDLGWFGRGKMVPEFEAAAFGMEKGEISDPVKTRFGFHVIRLDDRTEMTQKAFEEVKAEIVSKLKNLKQQEAVNKVLSAAREKHKLEINEENLKKVGEGIEGAAAPMTPPPPPSPPPAE
ncbi:MAG: peptidylprolyl isomerase [bacterium]